MKIRFGSVILRDYSQRDVEDCVRWMTTQREWHDWDAPWEAERDFAQFDEKKYRERMQNWLRRKYFPWPRISFQLYAGKRHVGLVNSYRINEAGEAESSGAVGCTRRAVGLDLMEEADRGHGMGTDALCAFVHHLLQYGESPLYLQTWRGNDRMVHLAEKIGFVCVEEMDRGHTVQGKPVWELTYRLDEESFSAFYRQRRLAAFFGKK